MLQLRVNVSAISRSGEPLGRVLMNVKEDYNPIVKKISVSEEEMPLYHVHKRSNVTVSDLVQYALLEDPSSYFDTCIGDVSKYVSNKWRFIEGNKVVAPSTIIDITPFFSIDGTPLYLKHKISSVIDSIAIVSSTGEKVHPSKYKLVSVVDSSNPSHPITGSALLHSLESSSTEVYFALFKDGNGTQRKELLDSLPVMELASNLSLNSMSSTNNNGVLLEYWLSETNDGFLLTLPSDYQKVAWRVSDRSIPLVEIPSSELNESCNLLVNTPRIKDKAKGSFEIVEAKTAKSIDVGIHYRTYERVQFLIDELLEVERRGVLPGHTNVGLSKHFPLELELYRYGEDNPFRVLTSDASLDGAPHPFYSSINYEYTDFSTSRRLSFVYSSSLTDFDYAYISYPYVAEQLAIQSIQASPILNRDLLGKKLVIYHVPFFPGQERSIEFLLVDKDNMITMESHSQPGSNNDQSLVSDVLTGLYYRTVDRSTQRDTDGIALTVNVGSKESFDEEYVDKKGYRVLCEIDYPLDLRESSNTVFTDLRKRSQSIKFVKENLSSVEYLNNSTERGIVPLSMLNATISLNCHWYLFSEWNKESLFDIQEIQDRFSPILPAGFRGLVVLSGVPEIDLDLSKDFSKANQTARIKWAPVQRPEKDLVVGAEVYTRASPTSSFSLTGLVNDISRTTSLLLGPGNDTVHVYLRPFIVRGLERTYGPNSNELVISFK